MKTLIALFFILAAINLNAQELVIFKCEPAPTDITARTSPRKDLNGELCCLIKVSSPANISKVQGNIIGDIIRNGQENWIYCSPGTNRIQLLFDQYNNIDIIFSEYGINNPESGSVIEVQLVDIIQTDEQLSLLTGVKLYQAKRYVPALKILKPLAERGNDNAQLLLAAYYLEEIKDKATGYAWLEKSAQTHTKSKNIYGAILIKEGNPDKGISLITEAADSGDTEAIELLINLYNGSTFDGKYKNPAKAYKYGYKLASKGDKNAQHFIACCLFSGTGTEKNEAEAVHWFTSAAQQGHKDAQRLLGAILITGCNGQAKDIEAAKRWLNMAAAQGDEEAKSLLKEIK